jgi:hypothetical protein
MPQGQLGGPMSKANNSTDTGTHRRPFLGEWRIDDLRQTDWWIGNCLRRLFPQIICQDLDNLLPPPFKPIRWEILGRFRPLGEAGRNLVAAAKSAEEAELRMLQGKGPLRGKHLDLKSMIQRRTPTLTSTLGELTKREMQAALRWQMVAFWIIGPDNLPDRIPLSICSDKALNSLFNRLGLVSRDGHEKDTLRKIRARLRLKPAAPQARWISDIEVSKDRDKELLEPVYGGQVAAVEPSTQRLLLHPRTWNAQWGWGTALPKERLARVSKRLLAAGWKKPETGMYVKPGRQIILRTVTNLTDPSRFWLFRDPI